MTWQRYVFQNTQTGERLKFVTTSEADARKALADVLKIRRTPAVEAALWSLLNRVEDARHG